jgi:glycosyltransferase involved in cell wall biosynthesis
VRILFLSEALSPHIMRWQNEFTRLGWEAIVASCDFHSDFTGRRLAAKGDRGPLRYLSIITQVERLIDEFQPHIINAHFLPTYGLTAALVNAHPLVLTLWGSDILVSGGRSQLQRLRSRFVLGHADLVLADAQCLIDAACRLGTVRRQLVVSFGVTRSWFESGSTRTVCDISTPEILSCRRFEKIYDIETLIRAAKLLVDDGFAFRLTLIGSGSQEQRLQAMVVELGLDSRVTFTGNLIEDELLSAYGRSDIYVSTALSDSTSVSLLEALSQKLYPVVTDIPGNREWIASKPCLFHAGDAKDLAMKIRGGVTRQAREEAYRAVAPLLLRNGIREEQMQIAHLTFRKLIDEYPRQ